MNIEEDLKICKDIMDQYKKLTSEDIEAALKISQLALGMYDRLNELRLQANVESLNNKNTKSDIKEYLRSKMKCMEYVYVGSRAIFNAANSDKKFKRL